MKHLTIALAFLAATAVSQAKLVTKAVPYEHGGTKLEGYLAYDDSVKTPRPGVLVIHEWWGLNDYAKNRAEALAKMGYVAFAADMFGAGTATTDAAKAKELSGQFYGKPLMAERARAGLDQLLKTGLVDEKRVASIGYCFGGTATLALAYSGAPLAAAVTFHGGLMPAPAGALDHTKTKFLVLHGGLDPMVKIDAVDAFKKSLDEAKADYQIVIYSGAVHAFSNPAADELAKKNNLQGGIGYNEAASRRSWAQMQAFFSEVFGKK